MNASTYYMIIVTDRHPDDFDAAATNTDRQWTESEDSFGTDLGALEAEAERLNVEAIAEHDLNGGRAPLYEVDLADEYAMSANGVEVAS